jgi:hypothetical protein
MEKLTCHRHGLKVKGSSYCFGFICTAGGQTITIQPAGIVYPEYNEREKLLVNVQG